MTPFSTDRVPLVLVTGLDRDLTTAAADALFEANGPGTVLVHHDVRSLRRWGVLRTMQTFGPGGCIAVEHSAIEFAHGCLGCTLRFDVLTMLQDVADRMDAPRIVMHLDPALEPEPLLWSVRHAEVAEADHMDAIGGLTSIVADYAEVEAVVAVIDAATWLDDASGVAGMADRGMAATADDERSVAQVCVGQVEFADIVLAAGRPADGWAAARLEAVLDRLAPSAVRRGFDPGALTTMIARLGPTARRGRIDGPHDSLLAGEPPLTSDAGVQLVRFSARRPFHPARLHDAVDILLEGVVRTRGRIWLATRPDRALWLESAGGGLRVGDAGPWLAVVSDEERDAAPQQRQIAAALRWDPEYGDRDVELVVLSVGQPGMAIVEALDSALLTNSELAAGQQVWADWDDPFGNWHEHPCVCANGAAPYSGPGSAAGGRPGRR